MGEFDKAEMLMPGLSDNVIASAPTMSFDEPPPAYGSYAEGNVTGIVEELPSYTDDENNMQPGGTGNVVIEMMDEWSLGDWLKGIDAVYYKDYYGMFVENGFESKNGVAVMSEDDLLYIGIKKLGHRKVIMNAIKKMGGAVTAY